MERLMNPLRLSAFAYCCSTLIAGAEYGLPDGFERTPFAGYPQITYPVGVSAAPTGEVYVSVDLNSSLDQEDERGKVVRCEDTDGDGVADHFRDFVPDIMSPRGSCFVDGTLYLVHPPFLSAFRDTNDDGIADQHEVLVSGLGFDLSFRGADHTSNGVRMGIDGWLYLAIGDYGFVRATARDGSGFGLHGGGVVRVRPDGTELEPYSLYTRNIYDVALSPKLDAFSRDNTNDGKGWNTRLHQFYSLADHGYPRLYQNFAAEALPPLADYGGGSGTGAYYLDEPGFPEAFNGKLYTCDFTTQRVYVHDLEPQEATHRISQDSFMEIKAIDMDADGSSSLYVSDWTNGGYRYGRPDVGGISRITYSGLEPAVYPDVDNATQDELVALLRSPSAVARINAQQALIRKGASSTTFAGLVELIGAPAEALSTRIAAIFAFKQLFGESANAALSGFTNDPSIREWALRALADRRSQLAGVDSRVFSNGLADANPRVRAQAIIGLERMGDPDAGEALLTLAIVPEDPMWLNEEIPTSQRYQSNEVLPHLANRALVSLQAVSACLNALDSADSQLRNAALRAIERIHNEEAVEGLELRLRNADTNARLVELMPAAFRLMRKDTPWDGTRWWTTRPDDRGPYFEPMEWEGSERLEAAVRDQFGRLSESEQGIMLIAMRRNRIEPEDLGLKLVTDEVDAVLNDPNPGTFALSVLREVALDAERPKETRVKAFLGLSRIAGEDSFKAQVEVAGLWRRGRDPDAELVSLVDAFIVDSSHQNKPKILRNALRNANGSGAVIVFEIALNILSSPLTSDYMKDLLGPIVRQSGERWEFLVAAERRGAAPYLDVIEKATESDNQRLAEMAQELVDKLQEEQATTEDAARIVELDNEAAANALMNAQGDVALGEALFTRQGCVACHTVSRDQAPKGPYLGDAGSKWNRTDLIQSILDPNAVLAQGFQTQLLTLNDSSALTVFITGEVDGMVTTRDIVGVEREIAREEIVKQETLTTSMMPPGLIANLNIREAASLLDYLGSLKAE